MTMTYTAPPSLISAGLTTEEFLGQYGDNPRYELIDGVLRDLEPTGPHEEVAGAIAGFLHAEIRHQQLNWTVPKSCLIRPPAAEATILRPDVVVLDRDRPAEEPLWQKEPIICNGLTVKLVVEVVSSNWQDDDARKLEEYAYLQIPEYWIVDFRALGGLRFIGNPKTPKFTVSYLRNQMYEQQQYGSEEIIESEIFPGLQLCLENLTV
jgi:Uma2 family endonuclease